MSNLKLPNFDYKPLHDSGRSGVVAYQTSISQAVTSAGEGLVVVTHHSTPIATLGRWHVSLNTGGYNSVTTSNRLNHIIRDNGIPFFVAVRGGLISVLHQDDKRTLVGSFRRCTFTLIGGTWVITDMDGANPYVQGVELNTSPRPCPHAPSNRFLMGDNREQCLECGAVRTLPGDASNPPLWHRPTNPSIRPAAATMTSGL